MSKSRGHHQATNFRVVHAPAPVFFTLPGRLRRFDGGDERTASLSAPPVVPVALASEGGIVMARGVQLQER